MGKNLFSGFMVLLLSILMLEVGLSADVLGKSKENSEAEKHYEKGRKAYLLLSSEGFEDAIKHYKEAIEADPDFPAALHTLAEVPFALQVRGTEAVGILFGPVTLLWFVAIGAAGVYGIAREPAVLAALSPLHALRFLMTHAVESFIVLGAVVLAVTGAEALYADMGHFGKRPVRIAWFGLVAPALVLNYFGQGALLMLEPAAVENPFYRLLPGWALYPMVALATAATVIASQAVISGAYSITKQAVQLGFLPRMNVVHTSAREMGQIYVPQVNWALMAATIVIVIGFGSSGNLAAAYGIAVTLEMVITVLLLYIVMTERWRWPLSAALAVDGVFLVTDLTFFGDNALKILQGGWVTLLVAAMLFTLMTTWRTGRRLLAERLTARAVPLEHFIAQVAAQSATRVPGTAVFMTAQPTGTPPALAHNLRYNKVLHEHVVVLTVSTAQKPHVAEDERVTVEPLEAGAESLKVEGEGKTEIGLDAGNRFLIGLEHGLEHVPADPALDARRASTISGRVAFLGAATLHQFGCDAPPRAASSPATGPRWTTPAPAARCHATPAPRGGCRSFGARRSTSGRYGRHPPRS